MDANNKLREALEMFCGYSATVLNTGMFNRVHLEALLNKAKAALASPRLNCEVGTPSEQYQRFLKYCKKNTGGCDRADRYSNPCAYCFSQWAQMPYKKGETNGSK